MSDERRKFDADAEDAAVRLVATHSKTGAASIAQALLDARSEIARLRVVVEAARVVSFADPIGCPELDALYAALDALPESTP